MVNVNNPVILSSGQSYSGSDTDNRAVTHDLGRIPKMVFLADEAGGVYFLDPNGALISGAGIVNSVTAMDATQFYVGAGVTHVGNTSDHYYYWTAI